MSNEYYEKSNFSGGIAKTLNMGGEGILLAYDYTVDAFKIFYSWIKKAGKKTGMYTKNLATIKTSEIKKIQEKIGQYENRIKGLYFEIGKQGSLGDKEAPLESDIIKKLINDVKEYEKEIKRLENRIVEIQEQKKAEKNIKHSLKNRGKSVTETQIADEKRIIKSIQNAISKALKHGDFDSLSEREIFDKVANDLLDSDIEIKILAAAELGKMESPTAVPILIEAINFNNSDLTSEIINSLITINDKRAIEVFKTCLNHMKFTVRIGCLRGIYKMADDDLALQILSEGLRDKHPEVRRISATFVGWRDLTSATPALIQCLRDNEIRVRKASVSALANIKDETAVMHLIKILGDNELEIREKAYDAIRMITGEDIIYDVHSYGKEADEKINNLKDWWQNERAGNVKNFINDEHYSHIDKYIKNNDEMNISSDDDDTFDENEEKYDIKNEDNKNEITTEEISIDEDQKEDTNDEQLDEISKESVEDKKNEDASDEINEIEEIKKEDTKNEQIDEINNDNVQERNNTNNETKDDSIDDFQGDQTKNESSNKIDL